MDRGGCLILLFLVLVAVLFFAFAQNTGVLDQIRQDLQTVGGTVSVQVAGGGTPAAVTPQPAAGGDSGAAEQQPAPIPTLAPTPVPNGRILFLGLDEYLWSVEPDGSLPVQLGLAKDFLTQYTNEWVSPNGQYVFVYRKEDGKRIAYITPVDGQTPPQRLGELPETFGLGEPRSYFDFSSDSNRAMFYEAAANRLVILTLATGQRIEWPLQPEAADFNTAAFAPGRSWFIVKGFDAAANGQYLDTYHLGETLTDPQRSQVFANERIYQFQFSPDGSRVALLLRTTSEANTERVLIVGDSGQVETVLENSLSRSLLVSPAWSPDGRYLLINSWQTGPQLAYRLLSYDTQAQALVNLLGDQPSPGVGQPISVAAGFAPDGAALTFRLYSGQSEAFWMAFLDGSYIKQVASAQIGTNPPTGEFVVGFTPGWERMALVVGGAEANALWGDLATAAIDGSGRVTLDTQVPYRFQELGPVISPDGQRLAYFRLLPETGQGELCIIGLDGSDRRVLFTARPEEMSQGKPVGIPWKWLPKP